MRVVVALTLVSLSLTAVSVAHADTAITACGQVVSGRAHLTADLDCTGSLESYGVYFNRQGSPTSSRGRSRASVSRAATRA